MKIANRAYLDCNATHPLLPEARQAVIDALDLPGNPSSVHKEGRAARQVIEASRRAVAAAVNGIAEFVTFTAGATEAANLLLTPYWQMGRSKLAIGGLFVCATEHPCMLAGGQFAADAITIVPVTPSGELSLAALEAALTAHDKSIGLPLVAVQHANNETGVVQPVGAIASIVKAHGGILIVDAVQTLGRDPLDISSGCGDFFILSSHKIGGPKGAGAIIGVTDLMMPAPLLRGGGQEKGRRAGTEALPAIAGFGAAANLVAARLERAGDLSLMRDHIEAIISEACPDAVFHGTGAAERLPNTTFFSIPAMSSETLQIAFDLAGVAVSAGSACSSGKVGPSHVLKAMGVEGADGAIRVSVALETSAGDIEKFADALRGICARRAASKST
ncbi:MAG: cysteine desulfurase family protein [Rhizobiaceae bacterium]